jgi:hydrogenase maturation protease
MAGTARTVLVIGYGNPGRLDDGLGPAFAAAFEELGVPGVTVESGYQLAVEDARTLADYDVVVFVDASLTAPDPFSFERVEPKASASFSSHIVEPGGVVALAQQLYKAKTEAYALGIRGHAFDEFGETLSAQAQANMAAALAFLERVVREGSFAEATRAHYTEGSASDTISADGDR